MHTEYTTRTGGHLTFTLHPDEASFIGITRSARDGALALTACDHGRSAVVPLTRESAESLMWHLSFLLQAARRADEQAMPVWEQGRYTDGSMPEGTMESAETAEKPAPSSAPVGAAFGGETE